MGRKDSRVVIAALAYLTVGELTFLGKYSEDKREDNNLYLEDVRDGTGSHFVTQRPMTRESSDPETQLTR